MTRPLLQHAAIQLDKSITLCLSRDPTSSRSAHPLIPVTRDEIIGHIAEGSGHQHTEVIQGPPPGELSHHPQSRCGLGIDMALQKSKV